MRSKHRVWGWGRRVAPASSLKEQTQTHLRESVKIFIMKRWGSFRPSWRTIRHTWTWLYTTWGIQPMLSHLESMRPCKCSKTKRKKLSPSGKCAGIDATSSTPNLGIVRFPEWDFLRRVALCLVGTRVQALLQWFQMTTVHRSGALSEVSMKNKQKGLSRPRSSFKRTGHFQLNWTRSRTIKKWYSTHRICAFKKMNYLDRIPIHPTIIWWII